MRACRRRGCRSGCGGGRRRPRWRGDLPRPRYLGRAGRRGRLHRDRRRSGRRIVACRWGVADSRGSTLEKRALREARNPELLELRGGPGALQLLGKFGDHFGFTIVTLEAEIRRRDWEAGISWALGLSLRYGWC